MAPFATRNTLRIRTRGKKKSRLVERHLKTQFDSNTKGPVKAMADQMAQKVLAATQAIKAAEAAVSEIVSKYFDVAFGCGKTEVSVFTLHELDQIPGEIEYIERLDREEYPVKARKLFDGVEFYTLLNPYEVEEFCGKVIAEQEADA